MWTGWTSRSRIYRHVITLPLIHKRRETGRPMKERRLVGLANTYSSHRTVSIVVNGLYAAPSDRMRLGGIELVRSRRLDFPIESLFPSPPGTLSPERVRVGVFRRRAKKMARRQYARVAKSLYFTLRNQDRR
ncbi:hypothetical protein HPB47_000370 [Ixodes persulcatus]|uniref:Uncharacterized protein n=1 Tax=Ixodes persulcatus TaxID=34615 RepID=A0AC60PS08_IXOPE|nr:hypothetical protein HPB47_000370 [Ixodes persulcatus]